MSSVCMEDKDKKHIKQISPNFMNCMRRENYPQNIPFRFTFTIHLRALGLNGIVFMKK